MTKEEREEKILKETELLVRMFLDTRESDIDLAKKTNISSSTVGRRLTNKEYILKAYPEKGEKIYEIIKKLRQENLLKGKALGGQTTLLNHVYTKDEEGKFTGSTNLRLDLIYKNPENQYKFLIHTALFFKLHLDTLSNLFQIDEKEIYDNMSKYFTGVQSHAIYILFHRDVTDQVKARNDFLEYYRDLINAIRKVDKEERKRLINIVTDYQAMEFKKRKKEAAPLSDEDILILLNYQLKYFLTQYDISLTFEISRPNYGYRVLKILENNPEKKSLYDDLVDMHSYKHRR